MSISSLNAVHQTASAASGGSSSLNQNASLGPEPTHFALKILRDSGSQTKPIVVPFYCGIDACGVYMNFAKIPLQIVDLKDLEGFGLASHARNIETVTTDGVKLNGWHLTRPSFAFMLSKENPDNKICGSESSRHSYQHNNDGSCIIGTAGTGWVDSETIQQQPQGQQRQEENQKRDLLRDSLFDCNLAQAERVVVYFHGNAGTRGTSFRVEKIKQIAALLRAEVVVFDYRGFGDSDGFIPSEQGTLLDAQAMVQWVRDAVQRGFRNSNSSLCLHKDEHSIDDSIEYEANMYTMSSDATYTTTTNSTLSGNQNRRIYSNQKNKGPDIFLYGHSLGSAVATSIAHQLNYLDQIKLHHDQALNVESEPIPSLPSSQQPLVIRGLILDAPFSSIQDLLQDMPHLMALRIFPIVKKMIFESFQLSYPTKDRLLNLIHPCSNWTTEAAAAAAAGDVAAGKCRLHSTSVILMHSTGDFTIPVTHSRRLYGYLQSALIDAQASDSVPATTTTTTTITAAAAAEGGIVGVSGVDTIVRYVELPAYIGHNRAYRSACWAPALINFIQEIARRTKTTTVPA